MNVFSPGTFKLRVQNATCSAVATWDVGFDIYSWNDADRGNTIDSWYSTDGTTYFPA
jgi:hypothetical protein